MKASAGLEHVLTLSSGCPRRAANGIFAGLLTASAAVVAKATGRGQVEPEQQLLHKVVPPPTGLVAVFHYTPIITRH